MSSPTRRFGMLLFTTEPRLVAEAVGAGVDGIVVDWEQLGKRERQAGWDTQVNADTVDDLRRVRAVTAARVVCRLNGFGAHTPEEVALALDAGADELLLPMVTAADQVERLLDCVAGRAGVGILIETEAAVECAAELGRLPLERVYVGLNDLAIDRGAQNIFSAVADGTVERVRRLIDVPFGFGGLTLPDRGAPIACRLLIAEIGRIGADFSFLRRSFLRDSPREGMRSALTQMRAALARAERRSEAAVERDRRALASAVDAWVPAVERVAVPAP